MEANLELQIQQILAYLGDNSDHPETWEVIKEMGQSHDKVPLNELTNYLQLLISIPQTPHVAKLLNVLHAVCLAHIGDILSAERKLTGLLVNYSQCPLVAGALIHVQSLTNPTANKMKLNIDSEVY